MDAIESIMQINYLIVILGFFALLFAAKEVIEILSYFKKKFRIKTGVETDKETIEQRILTLEDHDKWQYGEITKISNGIDDIRKQLLNTEIENIRWEILDFASSLTNKRKFSKEQFEHVISAHERYEKKIKENGLTNGLVASSIEVIKEAYKDCLKNGFD